MEEGIQENIKQFKSLIVGRKQNKSKTSDGTYIIPEDDDDSIAKYLLKE